MRILVLQLARLGDIFQSWPTLSALRREFPEAKLELLVRESFAAATDGLKSVDQIHRLPVRSILEPGWTEESGEDTSIERMNAFLDQLRSTGFDRIINLSFSPLSSYITHHLSSGTTQVSGYTRHADGYLQLPDDPSAYFYAQVGVGKSNRFHMCDIFSAVAGVTLTAADWAAPELQWSRDFSTWTSQGPYLVFHPGASQEHKCWPAYKWRQLLTLVERNFAGHCLLVGSADEQPIIENILEGSGLMRSHNLAGQTQVRDLFGLIAGAQVLVAGDSVAVQVASLTQTPTLNLSFPSVNFWETGPRALGSRVLWASAPEMLTTDKVADHIEGLLKNREALLPYVERDPSEEQGYRLVGFPEKRFEWDLIRGLYQGHTLPQPPDELVRAGMDRLHEAVHLALDQLGVHEKEPANSRATLILQHVDEIIELIDKMVPELRPLVHWFQAERIRIAPGDLKSVASATRRVFINMDFILSCYTGREGLHSLSRREHAGLSMDK